MSAANPEDDNNHNAVTQQDENDNLAYLPANHVQIYKGS